MKRHHNNPETPLDIPWEAASFGESAAIILEMQVRRAEERGIIAAIEQPNLPVEEVIARYNNDKPIYRKS